jgi:hypothetical protein
MSGYDDKKVVPKPILDNKDLTPAWEIIYNKLGRDGGDFRIVSLHPREKLGIKWFHASSGSKDWILITKPKDPEKNSGIKSKFRFCLWDFEKDAQLYNDYANGNSCAIRYTGTHTSSYVITLIAEFL